MGSSPTFGTVKKKKPSDCWAFFVFVQNLQPFNANYRMWNALTNAERKVFIFSFLLHLVTAFFSSGWFHPDEYFQIHEFAAWKLGNAPASEMPWEFTSQIRSCLQPTIVYFLSQIFTFFKIINPFVLTLLLRILSAGLAWWASVLTYQAGKKMIARSEIESIFLWLTCFLWFLTWQHVRFSSENWSAIFLTFGIFLIFSEQKNEIRAFCYGAFCFGISFWCRFQIGFALVGVGCWLLFVRKLELKLCLVLLSVGSVSLFLGVCLDRWFYGNWVFTPYNYFKFNILDGIAAGFSTSPWWDYFLQIFLSAIPPMSLLIIGLCAWATYKFYKNIFVFVTFFFFVAHCLIAHKELRFLFPMSGFIPVICCIALTYNDLYKKILVYRKWLIAFCVIPNFLLLSVFTFKPCIELENFYHEIYAQSEAKKTLILSTTESPFDIIHLVIHHYRHPNTEVKILSQNEKINTYSTESQNVFLFQENFSPPADTLLTAGKFQLTYRSVPTWLTYLNYNNWLARTRIWCLYKVEK